MPRNIFTAGATSGVILSIGDALCQLGTNDQRKPGADGKQAQRWDVRDLSLERSARYAITGMTLHGPYFHFIFAWLDKKFGSTRTLKMAATKALVGQFSVFPPYLGLFFFYQALLEGKTAREGAQRAVDKFPGVFVTGLMFWPAANTLNFLLLGPGLPRVAYSAGMSVGWVAYLSWVNPRCPPPGGGG
mmetsp:Transcript_30907/g.82865  ORF Transcript_30907/g.82865 Transcript_30907/m.82865 type:complete len:188 (-) Transcript_30907:35-598(-)